MKTFNRKQFMFAAAFVVVGFIALQVPLTHVIGSKVSFTLFDAFSPIAGGFLGGIVGAVSVFVMHVANFLSHGAHIKDAGTIIRFFPMMFAALYFGKKTILNIIIPAAAMIAFIANPIGHTVWFFSLYWLIPIVCYFFQEKSLIARSLGATFTAHAVGGALWIYFLPLPASVWIALIPIVAIERLVSTAGISVAYVAVNNALNYLNERRWFSYQFPVNPRYVWKPTSN